MVLHSSLSGADLHDPKGKSPTPLDLDDNTANAYQVRNTSAGATVLGIDTTNSSERVFSGINWLELNHDAVSTTSETCILGMYSANGVGAPLDVRYRLNETLSAAGALTFQVATNTNSAGFVNASTSMHIGTSGLTTPNGIIASLYLNSVNDAAAAIQARLYCDWNTTDDRAYLGVAGVHQLLLDNGSQAFIIGGGNHTSTVSTDSVVIGYGAQAQNTATTRNANVVIGQDAQANNQSGATCVGNGTRGTAGTGIAIGASAAFTAARGSAVGYGSGAAASAIAVGTAASATGSGSICIGDGASCALTGGIAIGWNAVNAIAANSCLIGANDASGFINTLVVGRGSTSGTASTLTHRTTNATGSNIAGWNYVLQGGLATGNAADGYIGFNSGNGANAGATTLNGAVERMRIVGGTEGHIQVPATSFIELVERTAPTTITGSVMLYAKDVAGTTKLFVRDEAGTETQLGT